MYALPVCKVKVVVVRRKVRHRHVCALGEAHSVVAHLIIAVAL